MNCRLQFPQVVTNMDDYLTVHACQLKLLFNKIYFTLQLLIKNRNF